MQLAGAGRPAADRCRCFVSTQSAALCCLSQPPAAEVRDLQQRLDAAAARADVAEGRLEQLQEANERFIEERKASVYMISLLLAWCGCPAFPGLTAVWVCACHPCFVRLPCLSTGSSTLKPP